MVRFFDINDLAAIRMEHLPVFQEVHDLVFKLIGEKKVTGLRVDHPDGLNNMLKAMRDAKVNTSWISPNEPYEDGLQKFVDALLSHNPFLKDFEMLARQVAYFGMLNSLSQTLLKITSPGTPDFFQGAEIWDFSLVDPDNRRPVDFSLRRGMLKKLKARLVQHEKDADEERGIFPCGLKIS